MCSKLFTFHFQQVPGIFIACVLCMGCVVGSAADIAKSALLYADQKLAALGVEARILLMIHDEIVWEVKDSTHISPLPY
jgi:hypothetical protein